MRIALVGPAHPYKGGSAQHTTELAHRLSTAGHEITLQSWSRQYPRLLYPGQLTVDEPEVELYPDTAWPLAWYRPDSWWLTGRRLARRFDAIVVSIFTPIQVPAYVTLAAAARSGGARVVALCHNVLPHESRRLDKPAMRALLRRVDSVVVHSAQEAELAASLTSAPVQIAALPLHLPNVDPAAPAASAVQDARNQLLFFGIVRHYKGLDLLLRAMAKTKPEVALTVAGEIWEGRDDLLALISDLQLGDRVTLTDRYVDARDVPGYFASADALVLPYRSGTASQNALIALQFGVPVIATRAGAIGDAVEDGVNGILCAPGDTGDLARAINELYEPGTLTRLRQGVRPPDATIAWADYVAVILGAAATKPDKPPAHDPTVSASNDHLNA